MLFSVALLLFQEPLMKTRARFIHSNVRLLPLPGVTAGVMNVGKAHTSPNSHIHSSRNSTSEGNPSGGVVVAVKRQSPFGVGNIS